MCYDFSYSLWIEAVSMCYRLKYTPHIETRMNYGVR